jgi:hypothetical protein
MASPVFILRPLAVGCTVAALVVDCHRAAAQEPPPIPLFAIDLHGVVASFPDDPALALSRDLNQAELPGLGFGGDVAAHVYPFRLRGITFGLGGRLMTVRARQTPPSTTGFRSVTERLTYLGPQLSFNFGTGNGWSYLSGGVSASKWSIVPDGRAPLPPDEERVRTLDYGGGARWFIRSHLAFSFDVRFYAIAPTSQTVLLPPGPRTTLLVVGAGVSIK